VEVSFGEGKEGNAMMMDEEEKRRSPFLILIWTAHGNKKN
jgi:hypothetical protein